MNNLNVRLAQLDDYKTVLETMMSTAKWLNKKGSSQWNDLLSGKDVHNTERAIQNNEVYLAELEGELVGMFVLWENQSEWDRTLWGEEDTDTIYYLHRVTLTQSAHGKRLGMRLVEAALEVAVNNHKHKVRLDCIADNRYLNEFYKSAGFQLKMADKSANEFNGNRYNLYEKILTE